MYSFTFYFKFLDDGLPIDTLFTWNVRAVNLKQATKIWTSYVQSGEQLLTLTEIEKNGVKIQS